MMVSWVALLEVLWTRKLKFSHPPSPTPENEPYLPNVVYFSQPASCLSLCLPGLITELFMNVGLMKAGTAGLDIVTQEYSIL